MTRAEVNGIPLFVQSSSRESDPPTAWGNYVMVPWAGRLRNATFCHNDVAHDLVANDSPHAIHGLAFSNPWSVVEHSTTSITLCYDFDSSWPFDGWCEHTISVEQHEIICRLSVHSSNGEWPAMLGWHPWFLKTWQLETDFDVMLHRDPDNVVSTVEMTPTQQPWDDCFMHARSAPTISNAGSRITLQSDCSHWMIYTEPVHAFCVEPMSGPPNSLDDTHPNQILVSTTDPLQRTLRFVYTTDAD
ncbi:MAG: aldose epimerase [Ilumatobacteraceae bacterium]|nr:aldose epimerase [Ilumatobacteraceae bacterium]